MMKPERIAKPHRRTCWMCGRVREIVMICKSGDNAGTDDAGYPIRICNICDRGEGV